MWFDETVWLPFVESDDADVTGPGHQSKSSFAAALAYYDRLCGEEPLSTIADVKHAWAVLDDNHRLCKCDADTPGAFPITVVWGIR